ncbi:LysR substrate binding domain protein [compost metagenome]
MFVSPRHPLAALHTVDQQTLAQHRELRLATIINPYETRAKGRVWSTPSYLMLLEMAQGGYGWAPLPRWVVARFGAGTVQELKVRGWPKSVSVHALWSRLHPPGPAGSWLLARILE